MIIPYRDPRELLVTQLQVEVGTIACMTRSVVIQCVDGVIWERNPIEALSIAIITIAA